MNIVVYIVNIGNIFGSQLTIVFFKFIGLFRTFFQLIIAFVLFELNLNEFCQFLLIELSIIHRNSENTVFIKYE